MNMDKQKIMGLLGMAQRAGKVVSGDFPVQKALSSDTAAALLIAEDASERTRATLSAMAGEKGVAVYVLLTKEELGHCLGKSERASAVLSDKGFAKLLEERLQGMG